MLGPVASVSLLPADSGGDVLVAGGPQAVHRSEVVDHQARGDSGGLGDLSGGGVGDAVLGEAGDGGVTDPRLGGAVIGNGYVVGRERY